MPNGDFNKLAVNNNANLSSKIETPNVKKRHRRAKSGGLKDPSQGDGTYGHILYNKLPVSLDSALLGVYVRKRQNSM